MSRKFLFIFIPIALIALIAVISAFFYYQGQDNEPATENFTLIEKDSFFSGRMPPAERQQFKNDPEKKHSCSIVPNTFEMNAGESAEFKVILAESDQASSYRLILGDLPLGVSGELLDDGGEGLIKLQAGDDPQTGSFNLSVIYQVLEKEGFFSEGKLKSAICQYNLKIQKK